MLCPLALNYGHVVDYPNSEHGECMKESLIDISARNDGSKQKGDHGVR